MRCEDLHKVQGEPQLHQARNPASLLPALKRHTWIPVVKSDLKTLQATRHTEEPLQGHTEGMVLYEILTAG